MALFSKIELRIMKIKNENIGSIDPRVDEYINKLLNSADGYSLEGQSRKILNYVVYLLLNRKFQHILQSFRLSLSMPADGLKNEEEQNLWKEKFKETLSKHHKGEEIDRGAKQLIRTLESKRPLVDINYKIRDTVLDVCDDAVVRTTNYLFRYLKLTNTRNAVYWVGIIQELLLFNNPSRLISYLSKRWRAFASQSLTFEPRDHTVKMSFMLYPDTTIKDIKQLIESKGSEISEQIGKIKGEARKNESKTDDIKRDYFIYRTYISHKINRKRDYKIYSNISKPEAVKEMAKNTSNQKEQSAQHLETESIRQIVDRMNKRIADALPDTTIELNAFLGLIAPKSRTY